MSTIPEYLEINPAAEEVLTQIMDDLFDTHQSLSYELEALDDAHPVGLLDAVSSTLRIAERIDDFLKTCIIEG